jgi:hypothetical protein
MNNFINSFKYYKYIDDIFKEELKTIYINIFSFYMIFFKDIKNLKTIFKNIFKKYKEDNNLFYYKESK